jgi:hypothetical protein
VSDDEERRERQDRQELSEAFIITKSQRHNSALDWS